MTDPLTTARLKVEDATARVQRAERSRSEASREHTSATNALNEAQKEFDATVEKIRAESATLGSNWGQRRLK